MHSTVTINLEQLDAVLRFAAKHGDEWKYKLMAAWLNGSDANGPKGYLLRQVRNHFGPQWLASFEIVPCEASAIFVEEMLYHYMVCALWSSNDESNENGGEPMDFNYSILDIDAETVKEMRRDCVAFLNKAWPIRHTFWTPEQLGHDFWLTRNGHGAGFWDRYIPGDDAIKVEGERLTEIAHQFGELNLYVGDDGAIHAE